MKRKLIINNWDKLDNLEVNKSLIFKNPIKFEQNYSVETIYHPNKEETISLLLTLDVYDSGELIVYFLDNGGSRFSKEITIGELQNPMVFGTCIYSKLKEHFSSFTGIWAPYIPMMMHPPLSSTGKFKRPGAFTIPKHFVKSQPMAMPTSSTFYLDFDEVAEQIKLDIDENI